MTPKTMRVSPLSNTRLEDVQPTILLTSKRSAPATTSATPIAEANFSLFTFPFSLLYSSSGVMSLYPLPWILMISIWLSAFRCLRSLVM